MALTLCLSHHPVPLGCTQNVKIWQRPTPMPVHGSSLFSLVHPKRLSVASTSIKVSSGKDFNNPNEAVNYLNIFVDRFRGGFHKLLEDFPWQRAKEVVLERLLIVGNKYFKWSFIVLLALSFISDATFAISRNKELLIPFGLFVGVTLADFLKEFSLDFFNKTTKGQEFVRHILLIGIFFAFVKLGSLRLSTQAQVLLSHVSNGGLMQALWLAKGLQQTEKVESQST